jgi:cytochrome c biogenesis protein CcmG/thiol:disulfide interchange protein DsbE
LNRKVLLAGAVVILPLLGILLANLGRDPHAIDSPLVGRPAPGFALATVGAGPTVSLDGLRGRPVVLNFWATWCVPCASEHPVLVAAARGAGDAQFLGIVFDDQEAAVQAWLRRSGSAYPSLMDPGGKVAIAYGISGVPETFFVDRRGVVVAKHVGPLDPDTLRRRLAEAAK